jgi:glycine cleavage system H protein
MVVKINSQLEDAPEQVNESAEEAAWIAEIQITDAVAELAQLMSREQYDAYLKTL